MLRSILSHSVFYKSLLNSRYIVALGFFLILLYSFQTITGILISSGVSKGRSLLIMLHSFIPSLFVLFSYIHLYKSMYFRWGLGTFKLSPYLSGWVCLLLLFSTCFSGYPLPWGQLSFWGTKVITTFLDYIPIFGEKIKFILWGSFSMKFNVVGKRFYTLHIILGIIFSIFILFHLYFVHSKKSVLIPQSSLGDIYNSTYLFPTFYLKDFFMFFFNTFLIGFILFFYFEFFEDSGNVEVANSLLTPMHIVPEWYFLPSFSILKYISNAYIGIIFSMLFIFIININLLVSYFYYFLNDIVSFLNYTCIYIYYYIYILYTLTFLRYFNKICLFFIDF